MAYVNNYVPPKPIDEAAEWQKVKANRLDPAIPYDVNFCYPVRIIENDRIRLEPFVVSVSIEMQFFS